MYKGTVALWLDISEGIRESNHLCILCPKIWMPHVREKTVAVRQPGTNTAAMQ